MASHGDLGSRLAPFEAVIAHDKGEWDRAFRAVDRATAVSPGDLIVLSVAACVCLEIGDDVRLGPFMRSVESILRSGARPTGLNDAVDWLGRAAWKTGRSDVAALAKRGLALAGVPHEAPPVLSSTWFGEAWVALAQADAPAIMRAYAGLDAYRLAPASEMREPESSDPVLLAALLEGSAGNLDRAVQRFDGSLTILRYLKYRSKLAWSLSEYAEVLQRRAQADDVEKATAYQDEALAIAQDLGMKPLIERIVQRKQGQKA